MIMGSLSVVAASLLLMGPAIKTADAVQTDNDLLQGAWTLVSIEANKQVIPLEKIKVGNLEEVAKLIIEGNVYTFQLGESRVKFTFSLDSGKSPKEIDVTFAESSHKGQVYRGIYILEGDTYTICRHIDTGKERPRQFTTEPNSGTVIVTWKREKPSLGPHLKASR
jgi:uncharacterized protein (TIGR03067 family)